MKIFERILNRFGYVQEARTLTVIDRTSEKSWVCSHKDCETCNERIIDWSVRTGQSLEWLE